jgi:hypothetical protein
MHIIKEPFDARLWLFRERPSVPNYYDDDDNFIKLPLCNDCRGQRHKQKVLRPAVSQFDFNLINNAADEEV